jgi:hypothetical protein
MLDRGHPVRLSAKREKDLIESSLRAFRSLCGQDVRDPSLEYDSD